MYKSLRKILLIISTVILSVVLAACGTKSQTESQQESQPKPLTSQEVIEKLLRLKWWDLDIRYIKKLPFSDINRCIDEIEKIKNGKI